MRFFLAVLLLLTAAMNVRAASLHACPADAPVSGAHETIVTRPDGSRQRVFVSEAMQIPGCRSMPLPLALDEIAGLVTVPASAFSSDRLIVHGPQADAGFSMGSVSAAVEEKGSGLSAMPFRENLLPQMRLRVFGAEERVQAVLADGRLRLQCSAGSKPAGVILSGPWRLTQANAELLLSAVEGSGRHEVQAQDAAAQAKESAAVLGVLAAGNQQSARFALPGAGFDRASWRAFAIACPRTSSALLLDGIRLLPMSGEVARRSTWVWQPDEWRQRPQRILAHAREHGIATLFISVPVQGGAVQDAAQLSAFVRAAAAHGIAVWSVDGDPQMVLPQEHAAGAARVRAYVNYNAGADAQARLGGMQFDVEHYLLPGYELAADDWDRRYVQLARALHKAAAGLPLEFVVPFWWADKSALLAGVTPYAASLTVMDYRTRADEILRFAQAFLDWGSRHRRQVRIALEAGPVAAEQQRVYTRAAQGGELWLLALERMRLSLLLKQPRPNPFGPSYRQSTSRLLDGSATSFHGDPARLLRLLPELERDLAAWPSFGGIALHELK